VDVRKWVGVAAVVVVVGAVGLWAFEPWRLFTSSTIDEAPPTSTVAADPTPSDDGDGTETPEASPTPRDRVLATGRFEDAEHGTSGTVRVLELGDGRRFVRLEDLATSDGPDLHVWVTDQPSGGDWGSYDDGRYVRLGDLKATHGNQNYPVPADADLAGLTSVVIWCDRFNVAFGTAAVELG
jgi:hypothetical protein